MTPYGDRPVPPTVTYAGRDSPGVRFRLTPGDRVTVLRVEGGEAWVRRDGRVEWFGWVATGDLREDDE